MTILLIRQYCGKLLYPLKLLYLGFSAVLANIICLSMLIMVLGAALESSAVVNCGFTWSETTIFWFGIPWIFISLIAAVWLFWHPGLDTRSKDNYASFCALSYCGYWLVLGLSAYFTSIKPETSMNMTIVGSILFVYFGGWGGFNIWLFVRYLVETQKSSR